MNEQNQPPGTEQDAQPDDATQPDKPELSKQERKRVAELEARFSRLVTDYAGVVEELDDVHQALAELGFPPETELAAPRASDTEALERKAADADAAYRRVLADYSNFQRRARENEQRAKEAGRAGVLENMVEVMDIFDLASRMNPETTSPQAMQQGVEMIKGELVRKLASHGFTVLKPSPGQEFDPHEHEATGHEDAEGVEPGCVVSVQKPGYKLNDRVLRPAAVTVRPGAHAETPGAPGAHGEAAGSDGNTPEDAQDHAATGRNNSN